MLIMLCRIDILKNGPGKKGNIHSYCNSNKITRTHSMARHHKSPRSQRYLMVFDPLTPSQGHQFDPRVQIFSVSWSAAHPL